MSIDIENIKPGDLLRFKNNFSDPSHYGYAPGSWVAVKAVAPADEGWELPTITLEPVPGRDGEMLEPGATAHNEGFGPAWFDEHFGADLYLPGPTGSISPVLAAGPAPRDLTTELAQVEDDRDVLAQVLSYALDRLPADERARVYGFWDARLAD